MREEEEEVGVCEEFGAPATVVVVALKKGLDGVSGDVCDVGEEEEDGEEAAVIDKLAVAVAIAARPDPVAFLPSPTSPMVLNLRPSLPLPRFLSATLLSCVCQSTLSSSCAHINASTSPACFVFSASTS